MCFTMLYCASLIDVSQLAAYPVLIPVYLVKYLFNTLLGPIETFALVEAASREVKCGSRHQKYPNSSDQHREGRSISST